MNVRRAAPVLGALAVASTVAGCSGGSSSAAPPASPQPTATVTVTETPTPSTSTPSVTPSATASASSPYVAIAAPCKTGQLTISLGSGEGAAGSSYQPIIFTNTSSKTCSLAGYPGVSFTTSSGTQLGFSAARSGATHSTVNLGPGGKGSALLRLPDPGVFSPTDCKQATAAKLQVYPPDQTASLTVDDSADICTTKTGRSSIGPVHAGSEG